MICHRISYIAITFASIIFNRSALLNKHPDRLLNDHPPGVMYKDIIQPILFKLDPEKAHHLTAEMGQLFCSLPFLGRLATQRHVGKWPDVKQFLMGLRFSNPVGIAAGFDKNGSWPNLLRFSGFGYAEFGSITAQPSDGNPPPRLFRLPEDHALINRMGLHNDGAETICRRITKLKYRSPKLFRDFPAGINIAKTHNPEITGDAAIEDYLSSYRSARTVADYITLNISCPNTKEGITFEDSRALTDLLHGIKQVRSADDPPLLVKFSPDTQLPTLDELVQICESFDISGYVLSNTSANRDGLKTPAEQLSLIGSGGLSGAPLFERNIARVAHVRKLLPDNKILIGCGGIDTPAGAVRMLKAGAHLLQVYTGFVYEGPALIPAINDAISAEMDKEKCATMRDWLQMHHKN